MIQQPYHEELWRLEFPLQTLCPHAVWADLWILKTSWNIPVFLIFADVPAASTVTGRTGWTAAAQMRCVWICYSRSLACPLFLTTCLMLQTKDKMCDVTDTTLLYPVTTAAVTKTTARTREVTAGRDLPSTSHPPTSLPTEGSVENLHPDLTLAFSSTLSCFCYMNTNADPLP